MSETTTIEYGARVWEGIDIFDAVAAVDSGRGVCAMTSATSKTQSRRSTTTSVRAVRAADAMIAYARRCGTGTEELLTVFADLRSDAHHLADGLVVDFR